MFDQSYDPRAKRLLTLTIWPIWWKGERLSNRHLVGKRFVRAWCMTPTCYLVFARNAHPDVTGVSVGTRGFPEKTHTKSVTYNRLYVTKETPSESWTHADQATKWSESVWVAFRRYIQDNTSALDGLYQRVCRWCCGEMIVVDAVVCCCCCCCCLEREQILNQLGYTIVW